ncbi:hypothetical protein PVAND_009674 [Polypedilum vanderplanki]|uniref:Peptidase M14 domain-containing protein n=1 Tax=Polypedilum vanderplanki TaxID=319348 RepID=A0A9J6CDZ0_POLVA|nr:hypothetical protein PVAND_009674 [Polypedilum vanderplanki]
MKWKSLLTVIALSFSIILAEKARFDFYRVYEISVDNDVQLNLMKQISDYPDGYQFLSSSPPFTGIKTQLIVPPHKFGEWSELVENFDLQVKLINNNLQASLDREEACYNRRKADERDFNSFWRYEEIQSWFQEKVAERPNDLSIFSIGTSYEGNEINGLRINVGNQTGKPSIFIEATIHGGEWLGATSTINIINEMLINNYTHLSYFDWYFLPVLNVDGFKYAWSNNRFWRKTRKPNNSLLCVGADPNRNSDIHWNESSVSANPCSNNYPGDYAFSEPEIKNLSEFMKTVPNLKIYLSFHTFGQFFMIPTGFTDDRIENYQLHYEIGEIANAAITEATGAIYQLGPIPEFFGLVSGISFDWVFENIKPVLTYCWELRPTRGEVESELDPVSSKLIEPTAKDMYAAVTTVIDEAEIRGVV